MTVSIAEIMRRLRPIVLLSALLTLIPGCASKHHRAAIERTAYLDDKVIAARVAQNLKQNPDYRFPHVQVQATNGVVVLTGEVETAGQKQRATELARRAEQVREVENRLNATDTPQKR